MEDLKEVQTEQTTQQKNLANWLALWLAPSVGPSRFRTIISKFTNLKDLFHQTNIDLTRLGFSQVLIDYLRNPNWQAVEQSIRWMEASNHHIITWQDSLYPTLLKEISASPPILFVKGRPEVLNDMQLAMVGSRNPSHTGADTAHQFAQQLVSSGYTITSGLAAGIDTASHQGALAGYGSTIAVVGTGLDQVYPRQNIDLADQIANKGALVSEFPLGTKPAASNFPRRNRIISGLSVGTLVVEAAVQSGSLITASYANEQSREVFAIPGSIHNPLSRGCHRLIQNGAKLVETASDIIEEIELLAPLNPQQYLESNSQEKLEILDKDHQKLVKCVGFETTPIDVLVSRSGLMAEKVSSMLLALEMQGFIKSVPGGFIRV